MITVRQLLCLRDAEGLAMEPRKPDIPKKIGGSIL